MRLCWCWFENALPFVMLASMSQVETLFGTVAFLCEWVSVYVFFFCYFLFFNAMRSRCGWSFVQTHVRTLITPLHSKHAINFDAQAYSVAVSVRSLSLSTRLTGRLLVAILFALNRFCCFVCGSLSSVLYQYRLWVHPIVVVRFFKLFF